MFGLVSTWWRLLNQIPFPGTWVLSALVGLLVLYGLVHIVAILHRKRGELRQLMKGPNKLILTYQDVSFTDQGKPGEKTQVLEYYLSFLIASAS